MSVFTNSKPSTFYSHPLQTHCSITLQGSKNHKNAIIYKSPSPFSFKTLATILSLSLSHAAFIVQIIRPTRPEPGRPDPDFPAASGGFRRRSRSHMERLLRAVLPIGVACSSLRRPRRIEARKPRRRPGRPDPDFPAASGGFTRRGWSHLLRLFRASLLVVVACTSSFSSTRIEARKAWRRSGRSDPIFADGYFFSTPLSLSRLGF